MQAQEPHVSPLAQHPQGPTGQPSHSPSALPRLTRALDQVLVGLSGVGDTSGSIEYASWLRLLHGRSA